MSLICPMSILMEEKKTEVIGRRLIQHGTELALHRWMTDALRSLGLSLWLVFGLGLPAVAQTPEEKGLAIAEEADRRDQGWEDMTVDVTMLLKNKQGGKSLRELRIRGLEIAEDGDKRLVIFDSPRDVKGTALLTFSHKAESDDQWLYLPAVKRVKRIASDNKSGPFVGSEFSYEDMAPQEVEKYTYNYIRDDTYDGTPCFVLERFPVDENSGYTKEVVWIDKEEYRTLRIEYYDRKASHLKTLTKTEWKQHLGKYWRPHKSFMQNHQTGKSTLLTSSNLQFKTGLSDTDFKKSRLKSVR